MQNITMGRLIDQCVDKYGDREGLVSVHQNKRMTFAQMKDMAEDLAAGLLALGLQPGDRLGILGPNTYQWFITQWASAKGGFILVNINPAYQPRELMYCLNNVEVKALISDEKLLSLIDYYKVLNAIMPEIANSKAGEINSQNVPSLKHVIMMTENNYP